MDYSDLYETLMGMNEQRKKDNFNAFMNGLNAGLVKDLNKAFQGDRAEYEALLARIKALGFRVFRDSKGRHKIEVAK
jgi:hypothetical protein